MILAQGFENLMLFQLTFFMGNNFNYVDVKAYWTGHIVRNACNIYNQI